MSDQLIDVPRTFVKRRRAFIPYVLCNLTGLPLKFDTLKSNLEGGSDAFYNTTPANTNWTTVMPGDSVPFIFDGHKKQRHKRTDQLSIHQV